MPLKELPESCWQSDDCSRAPGFHGNTDEGVENWKKARNKQFSCMVRGRQTTSQAVCVYIESNSSKHAREGFYGCSENGCCDFMFMKQPKITL